MCVIVCVREITCRCMSWLFCFFCRLSFHKKVLCTFLPSLPQELRITHLGHLPSQSVGGRSVLFLLSLSKAFFTTSVMHCDKDTGLKDKILDYIVCGLSMCCSTEDRSNTGAFYSRCLCSQLHSHVLFTNSKAGCTKPWQEMPLTFWRSAHDPKSRPVFNIHSSPSLWCLFRPYKMLKCFNFIALAVQSFFCLFFSIFPGKKTLSTPHSSLLL